MTSTLIAMHLHLLLCNGALHKTNYHCLLVAGIFLKDDPHGARQHNLNQLAGPLQTPAGKAHHSVALQDSMALHAAAPAGACRTAGCSEVQQVQLLSLCTIC